MVRRGGRVSCRMQSVSVVSNKMDTEIQGHSIINNYTTCIFQMAALLSNRDNRVPKHVLPSYYYKLSAVYHSTHLIIFRMQPHLLQRITILLIAAYF